MVMIPKAKSSLQRLSPGIYRNAAGRTIKSATGQRPVKKVKNPIAKIQPVTPATPVTPVETAPPATTPPAMSPPLTSPGNTEALFPSTRMFEPKNYEGSPLYQFQVKSGMDQLTKSLAARGLYNSGKAIQDEINIPRQAAAQDTDRMTRVASENADRLKSFQDNEALRLERAGNAQWDRQFNLASLMAQQSPWAASLAGLNNTADLTKQSGDAQANYLRDAYNRVIASGGGGGRSGGSGTAATPIALPTGPDYSNIAPTQIGGDYSSNKGWLNILTGLAGSLF